MGKRNRDKEKGPFKIRLLYECFGRSKQAYYKRLKVEKIKESQAIIIRELIAGIRSNQSRCGARKIYLDIQSDLKRHNIKMGRDALFRFMRENQLLVRKTRRFHITTDSRHRFNKSPNRIKDITPTRSEQIWVCDITYVRIQEKHGYLALVTDLYSKKIMGFSLDSNMRATLVVNALKMALNSRQFGTGAIIHHSDRGIQYCCPEFTGFAHKNNIILSTTEKYDPYENAVAERINGILKYEFGFIKTLPNLVFAQKMIRQAVQIYNGQRRHMSLEMQTPNFAHTNQKHQYKSYKKVKF